MKRTGDMFCIEVYFSIQFNKLQMIYTKLNTICEEALTTSQNNFKEHTNNILQLRLNNQKNNPSYG